MKGVIFQVVEEVVSARLGPEAWDKLLTTTDVSGVYTSLGSYPDAELIALVEACAEMTSSEPSALLQVVGNDAIPILYHRYPLFFDNARNARSFILGLNTIIHPEVRKLYAGASCPHFHFVETENTITMGYNSPRRLCHLAHGFVLGLARHFEETIDIERAACMHDGAPMCHIKLVWK